MLIKVDLHHSVCVHRSCFVHATSCNPARVGQDGFMSDSYVILSNKFSTTISNYHNCT